MSQSEEMGRPGREGGVEARQTLLLRLAHWQLRRREVRSDRPRRRKLVVGSAIFSAIGLTSAGAFAYFTASGSGTGQAQAASVSNLTVTAIASPVTNQLYPGSAGDVVLKITNPNVFPVTITAVSLPSAASYATGYTDSALTHAIGATCDSTSSLVAWNYASNSNPHTLASSLTVGANGATLTVTMTKDALMDTAAPAACEAAYFSMPSLTGLTATSSTSLATSSPATDSWSS